MQGSWVPTSIPQASFPTVLLIHPHFPSSLFERAGTYLQALALWMLGRCSDLLGGGSPTELWRSPHPTPVSSH